MRSQNARVRRQTHPRVYRFVCFSLSLFTRGAFVSRDACSCDGSLSLVNEREKAKDEKRKKAEKKNGPLFGREKFFAFLCHVAFSSCPPPPPPPEKRKKKGKIDDDDDEEEEEEESRVASLFGKRKREREREDSDKEEEGGAFRFCAR